MMDTEAFAQVLAARLSWQANNPAAATSWGGEPSVESFILDALEICARYKRMLLEWHIEARLDYVPYSFVSLVAFYVDGSWCGLFLGKASGSITPHVIRITLGHAAAPASEEIVYGPPHLDERWSPPDFERLLQAMLDDFVTHAHEHGGIRRVARSPA